MNDIYLCEDTDDDDEWFLLKSQETITSKELFLETGTLATLLVGALVRTDLVTPN